MLNLHQIYLQTVYLDYRNDYLTIEVMAGDYGISVACMKEMIDEGKRVHELYNEVMDAKEKREGKGFKLALGA